MYWQVQSVPLILPWEACSLRRVVSCCSRATDLIGSGPVRGSLFPHEKSTHHQVNVGQVLGLLNLHRSICVQVDIFLFMYECIM